MPTKFNNKKAVWCASRDLSAEVVLNVHLVAGPELAVFVDSGISAMYDDLLGLIDQAGVPRSAVRLILNTHSHHDHIGSNGLLRSSLGCLVAAPAAFARWHSDFAFHYEEFANAYPDILEDRLEQREDILSSLGSPHHVDLHLREGSQVALGDGVDLTCLELPGHMSAEVGFIEAKTGVLLLGDVLTGTTWSFFHGYVDVAQYRRTLDRLRDLMSGGAVDEVHAAHYPILSAQGGREVVAAIAHLIDSVEAEVFDVVQRTGSASVSCIWEAVCNKMNKNRDFRALNVVTAHVRDLVHRGVLVEESSGRFSPA
jgi:glyoxylase-like metal-dependent hydrolase (beta-lactamase superfamily II)